MKELKVPRDASPIVCYDFTGLFAVARVAWMFRYFGATNVKIMRGGMTKWLQESRPFYTGEYEKGDNLPITGDYGYAVKDSSLLVNDVRKMHGLAKKLHDGCNKTQITDARGAQVFLGQTPTGQPELRPGNITGSLNIPSDILVADGALKERDELRKIFSDHGIDLNKQTVHSCNSGNTACIVELAWQIAGGKKSAIYDGSWQEYVSQLLNGQGADLKSN